MSARSTVSTDDLARVIDRATSRGGWTLARLAESSGVCERKLTSIRARTYTATTLAVADRILCALGKAELLLTGEVRYVQDPRGRRARGCAPA